MKKKLDIISLNKKAWNNAAKIYEQAKYGKLNELAVLFCEKLPEKALILDLGSGTGIPFTKYFVDKGFKVLGIDISAQMVKLSQANVPEADFKELSMTDLDYINKFDGIFSNYSMLCLNPPLFKDVASRLEKALKNNGLLYIALNEPRELEQNLDEDVFVEIMGEKMYSRAYTEKEILETFTPLGLTLLKIHREIINSKEFGIEYCTRFLFKKMPIKK
ncbi:MAG: class I SAM-dependent methyltransferase [Candidatus Hermodarchaeota archaeon]